MIQKQITKFLTAKDNTFVYTMRKPEDVTISLMITSSISCAITYAVTMNATKGNIHVRCVVLPKKNAHISVTSLQTHNAPCTKSTMHLKSVIMDKSMVEFQGNVYIGKSAQQSDAYQKIENLIVGEGGVVVSSPKLEILHNNVRCSHGVATGTIPSDVLFYLQTRGICESSAKALFVEGFIRDSIGDIQDKRLRKKLFG